MHRPHNKSKYSAEIVALPHPPGALKSFLVQGRWVSTALQATCCAVVFVVGVHLSGYFSLSQSVKKLRQVSQSLLVLFTPSCLALARLAVVGLRSGGRCVRLLTAPSPRRVADETGG